MWIGQRLAVTLTWRVGAGIRAVGGRLLDRCRTDFESFVESQRAKPNDYFNQVSLPAAQTWNWLWS